GGEAHNFPFVTKRLKAEHVSDAGVEDADRVRVLKFFEKFHLSTARLPERSCLTRASPVDHEDGCVIKFGQTIGAQGVRQMVVDEVNRIFRLTERADEIEFATAMALLLHESEQQLFPTAAGTRPFSGQQQFQVV